MKATEITEPGFYWVKEYYFDDCIVELYLSHTGMRARGIIGCPDFQGASPLLTDACFKGKEFKKIPAAIWE